MRETPIRDDGLQIGDDRLFQNRFWRAERIAWLAFGAVIALAVLGATDSGGPLATRTASSRDLSVEAPAISRWEAKDSIFLSLSGEGGIRTMEVNREFSEVFEVSSITPQPVSAIAVPDGIRWQFTAEPGADAEIRLVVVPKRPGHARYSMRSGAGTELSFATLVLP